MELILLIVLCVLGFFNLIALIAIGAFLVRFRDRTNGILSDFLGAMGELPPPAPTVTENKDRPKTWDEKYEEELEAMQRRLRAESGLVNLPDPGLSWGQPPALNPQNTEGLTIQDK